MYTLDVLFEKEDLNLIYQTDEKVVLIKKVAEGGYKVAWLAFTPYEHNNIKWNNDYFLYSSYNWPTEGIKITIGSTTLQSAQDQSDYKLNSDKTFSKAQPDSSLQPGQYLVVNDVPSNQHPWLIFGLAQSYLLNDQPQKPRPVNAVIVPARQFARFTPENKVLIFLASNLTAGMIHNNVRVGFGGRNPNPENETGELSLNVSENVAESLATELDFNSNDELHVKYFAREGKFIVQ